MGEGKLILFLHPACSKQALFENLKMKEIGVLFVCLGNICRSPSAEAVFQAVVENAGLKSRFVIDSAGISAYHQGDPADGRMQKHAIKRAYQLNSISRPVDANLDFDRFDLIIGMDDQNMADLERMAPSAEAKKKLFRMTYFCRDFQADVVPDPYYGGAQGFEHVLDLLEDATLGLLEYCQKQFLD